MENLKVQKDICDGCKREILCAAFTADAHYHEVSLCKSCLFEALEALWNATEKEEKNDKRI